MGPRYEWGPGNKLGGGAESSSPTLEIPLVLLSSVDQPDTPCSSSRADWSNSASCSATRPDVIHKLYCHQD